MPDLFITTSPLDPRAQPLVEDLIREYDERYGTLFSAGGARDEVFRYPPSAFSAPEGLFLLLQRDGETIGGGAFMRYDAQTAEFKRIWTRSDLRRQGLALVVLQELERRALQAGYQRLFLTTGFRQPEAVRLYTGHGYQPQFDLSGDLERYGQPPHDGRLRFIKVIGVYNVAAAS